MKIKNKVVNYNTYICENCNSEHSDKSAITKCDICGKELCDDCSMRMNIYYTAVGFTNIRLDIRHLNLCRECKCKDEISKKYSKYVNRFDEKQLELIDELNKVTDDFLEEIKNDQT